MALPEALPPFPPPPFWITFFSPLTPGHALFPAPWPWASLFSLLLLLLKRCCFPHLGASSRELTLLPAAHWAPGAPAPASSMAGGGAWVAAAASGLRQVAVAAWEGGGTKRAMGRNAHASPWEGGDANATQCDHSSCSAERLGLLLAPLAVAVATYRIPGHIVHACLHLPHQSPSQVDPLVKSY